MPEPVEVTVVRNGGKDILMVPTAEEELVASMLRDREGYIRMGELHLIEPLDATLRYHGYTGPLPEYETETKPTRKRSQ